VKSADQGVLLFSKVKSSKLLFTALRAWRLERSGREYKTGAGKAGRDALMKTHHPLLITFRRGGDRKLKNKFINLIDMLEVMVPGQQRTADFHAAC
jgi:hypothetical protein